jgi:hypothetical protein
MPSSVGYQKKRGKQLRDVERKTFQSTRIKAFPHGAGQIVFPVWFC